MIRFTFVFKGKKYLVTDFKKNNITNKYLSWLNDKERLVYSRHRYIKYTKTKCYKFLKNIKKNKNLFLAIYCLSEKNHIGNSIIILDRINKSGEISILIGDKSFLNKGITSYIWKKIIEFIFAKYKLRIMIAGSMADNKAMLKIFKKNKMKLFVTPKRFLKDNKEIDGVYACIKNKNF